MTEVWRQWDNNGRGGNFFRTRTLCDYNDFPKKTEDECKIKTVEQFPSNIQ